MGKLEMKKNRRENNIEKEAYAISFFQFQRDAFAFV